MLEMHLCDSRSPSCFYGKPSNHLLVFPGAAEKTKPIPKAYSIDFSRWVMTPWWSYFFFGFCTFLYPTIDTKTPQNWWVKMRFSSSQRGDSWLNPWGCWVPTSSCGIRVLSKNRPLTKTIQNPYGLHHFIMFYPYSMCDLGIDTILSPRTRRSC